MTVKELMEVLAKCPENAEVRLENGKLVENPSLIYAPFVYASEYGVIIK
jgi:hypothetical protein